MGLFSTIQNEIKAAVGYQQSFTELLAAKDVARALSMMRDRSESAIQHLQEYEVSTHKVMEREDRAVYDKKGNFLRWSKRNKIPIPYQVFINEIALVFLYGRPVKWTQKSEGTDYSFDFYNNLMSEIRFNACVREAKRVAGAEGVSAILYHTYKDENNQPRLLLNVLSAKNKDTIYTIKDQYKRLTTFAWGYYLTEAGNRTVYHVDIYTKDTIYRAKRANVGWEVIVMPNPVGKIPVLLFEQEPEHSAVQPMIEKVEGSESTEADVIDRFANPAMVATAEILNSLPKSEDEAKLFILKNGGDVRYLTWDQASESKKNQFERLDKHILSKSFTPNIDFDNMKSLGAMSAKAIRKVMMLAVIKAEKHKESHDGYMNRHASLMKAIMGNVLDYRHKSEHDALQMGHEFQEPFGDDVSEMLSDLSKQYNDGALSRETYIELSYLVKDAKAELDRIKQEEAERLQQQMEQQSALNRLDAFGGAE
nr:MAG TPA: portal protein [Caudoviricetes sp.]